MKLSLIIPCYNEALNLPLLIDRCRTLTAHEHVEVVLVDNGSSDDTPTILSKAVAEDDRLQSVRVDVNQGYGFGILAGLAAAKGDVLAWTHADMQTDPADALEGFKFFAAAQDPKKVFVKGLRYGRPMGDRVFTAGMSAFETLLMAKPLRDINAQPTMMHRAVYEAFDAPPKDFSLDLYAYALAKELGCTVSRFPVKFGERAHGVSHWNIDMASKTKFIKRTLGYSFALRKKMARNRAAS